MIVTTRLSLAVLTALLATGCSRGCSGIAEAPVPHAAARAEAPEPAAPEPTAPAPTPPPATPANPAPKPPDSLPDKLEKRLGFELPRRLLDAILPGLATFPRRKLAELDVDRELLIVATAAGAEALGHKLAADKLDDETALDAYFAKLVIDWEKRAGIPAKRAVLALDRTLPSTRAAVFHRLAQTPKWSLVVLAREGDDLYELVTKPRATTK